jgi:hypothetical protein
LWGCNPFVESTSKVWAIEAQGINRAALRTPAIAAKGTLGIVQAMIPILDTQFAGLSIGETD